MVGIAFGIAVSLVNGQAAGSPGGNNGSVLVMDLSQTIALLSSRITQGINIALAMTLLWLLYRIPTRSDWLASVLMAATLGAAFVPIVGISAFAGPALAVILIAILVLRFGVLAAVAYTVTFALGFLGGAPWTMNVSAWYAQPMVMMVIVLLGVAIYGFRTTLAGRRVLSDRMREEIA